MASKSAATSGIAAVRRAEAALCAPCGVPPPFRFVFFMTVSLFGLTVKMMPQSDGFSQPCADKKSGRPSVEKRPRQRKVGANAKHLEPPAERRSGYPPPQVVCNYASRIVIFSPMAASRLIVKSKSAPSS